MKSLTARTTIRRALAVAASASLLVACSSDDAASDSIVADSTETDSTLAASTAASISIEMARAPLPADGVTEMRVYGILVNDAITPMYVVSATSPAATSVDLLSPEDATVLPSVGLEVGAEGGLVLEPVNYKLRLNGVDAVELGDLIPVTLRFDNDETFTFEATVQELDQ